MPSVLLLAAALAGAFGLDLGAAAAASGTPRECALPGGRASGARSVWARTVAPTRVAYCAALAKADASMDRDPAASRAAAAEARKLEPSRAAPYVALGRAEGRLGSPTAALEAFERALALDPLSLGHPDALRGHAGALRRAGRLPEALRAYRLVVSRLAMVPDRRWRASVLLEAAHVCLRLGADGAHPNLLDEAHSYLGQALGDPHHELRTDVLISFALVLDRSGRSAQADAVLGSGWRAERWRADHAEQYLVAPADKEALLALATERASPEAALGAWQRFVDSADVPAPWVARARERMARLERLSTARASGTKARTPNRARGAPR